MRMIGIRQRLLLATAVTALCSLATMGVLSADPGSKEDPLATVSYVQQRGMFTLRQVPAGTSIRLGTGAELIISQPATGQVAISELDLMRDDLLDITEGRRLDSNALLPAHHYVNGSAHDIFIRPANDCALLLRGEWK